MNHRSVETFFVITAPGFEEACAEELRQLEVDQLVVKPGGVEFRGRLVDLYRCNLWLRTASRVVVRLASFRCRDFPDLYKKGLRLPWGKFLRPGGAVSFRVTARQSRLIHGKRVAETLQSAVERALGHLPETAAETSQLVLVRIVDDEVVISIDSSGDLLHRRGYRQSVTPAPLRETLAAGCLLLLGWNGSQPLADPMCGTGSFLSEAVLLATRRAPGLERRFAFMNWPGYRDGLWQQLTGDARHGIQPLEVALSGGDRDPEAIAAAKENLERVGCAEAVDFSPCPLTEQVVHAGTGVVISNPPYGLRLVTEEPIEEFYAGLGRDLQSAYPRWQKALLCPDPELVKATGLPFELVAQLDNGGLQVGLYRTKPG